MNAPTLVRVLCGGTVVGMAMYVACAPMGNQPADDSATTEVVKSVALDTQASRFELQPGIPELHDTTGAVQLDEPDDTIVEGSLGIDLDQLTVTLTGSSKAQIAWQTQTTILISAWIGQLGTDCRLGEQYGPFTVTLNAAGEPIRVEPASVALTATTIQNLTQFQLCVEVEVTGIAATVELRSFSLTLQIRPLVGTTGPLLTCSLATEARPCGNGGICINGTCVDDRTGSDEFHFDETNFPVCGVDAVTIDPGAQFCTSDADCADGVQCCTGPEICGSNPCTCRN